MTVLDPLHTLNDCVGKPARVLLPCILDLHHEIAAITFVAYRPAPNLAERLEEDGGPSREILHCAEDLHNRYGVGFWDSILNIGLRRGELGSRFVELALIHDAAPDEREYRFTRSEVLAGRHATLLDSPPEGYGVAISSRVHLEDGSIAHLPMLDFRCPHSAGAIAMLRSALAAMGQGQGVLVRSPRSYHYYGLDLVSERGLTTFLARALLAAPIVDARYIGHRLLDGACRLRLVAVSSKGDAPVVHEILNAHHS